VEIDEDRYMDYIALDAATNRGIDDARDLLERAANKPSNGRYKVFTIDEAHQHTKDAFSALLKTLEEPPDYLKFVLATTDPEKMLPTVLSRCLQFNLRPMAPEVIFDHLQRVLQAESVVGEAAALRLLARAARGSMRDALSLTDQAIAYGAGRLDEAGVRGMLGAVDDDHAAALVEALAMRDGPVLLARIEQLRSLGQSASGTLESMATLLQRMAVEQAVPGALADDDLETGDARRLATAMPADETQLLYSIVLQGRAELALMSDEYGALTMVLLRMLAFVPAGEASPDLPGPATQPASAPAKAPAATSRPVAAPARSAETARTNEPPPWVDLPADSRDSAPPPGSAALRASPPAAIAVAAAAPSTTVFNPTALGTRWAGIVGELLQNGAVTALARELALQAGLAGIDGQTVPPTWQLCVERDSLRTDMLRDKLGQALQAHLDEPLQLVLQPGVPEDSPARRESIERERKQHQAEAAIRSDPVVLDLMAQFKSARIVPGSIKPL
jgi:DNA polymerase-3 subunit gamma/tau